MCFLLSNGEESTHKIVVIQHLDIRNYAQRTGRVISDTWCSRIGMLHIKHAVETAEDLEKEYLAVTPREIEEYDAAIQKWEKEWVKSHAA